MLNMHQLSLKPKFWGVSSSRNKIKPFPGRWPTRWALVIKDGRDRLLFHYWGRPNPLLLKRIELITKNTPSGKAMFVEFDRAGAFRLASRDLPCKAPYNITSASPVPQYAYYPWHDVRAMFTPWTVPMYTKKLVAKKGQVYFVYCPTEKFGEQTEQLETYFRWRREQEGKSKKSKK